MTFARCYDLGLAECLELIGTERGCIPLEIELVETLLSSDELVLINGNILESNCDARANRRRTQTNPFALLWL